MTLYQNGEVKTGARAFTLVFTVSFPNSWFYWNHTTRKSVGKAVCNLLQATCSIPFSHSEICFVLFCFCFFWAASWSVLAVQICLHSNTMHCKQLFLEVSLVRIHCYVLTVPLVSHLYKVNFKGKFHQNKCQYHDRSGKRGKHTSKPQQSYYTLTLVNAKRIYYLWTLKCLCYLTDRTYIVWYRWKEEIRNKYLKLFKCLSSFGCFYHTYRLFH